MVMKYYKKEDLKDVKTLEDIWQKVKNDNFDYINGGNDKFPDASVNRKQHFLKYLPEGGSHREIGTHQGLNIARLFVDYKVSYVDSFDITDEYIKIIMPYFNKYCKENNVKLDFKVTAGYPVLEADAKMVDTTWIDACKRGNWVHKMLREAAKTTKYAIAVDDLVCSPDIIRGVEAFKKEQKEWVLDYEDKAKYPGIAVFVKKPKYTKKSLSNKLEVKVDSESVIKANEDTIKNYTLYSIEEKNEDL